MVELVPRSTWGWNLRSELTRTQWDRLRKATYARAGNRCEVCGGKGRKHPVECHERWEYDDEKHVQKLVGLEALCPPCHKTKHFGFAVQVGLAHVSRAHLMKVNDWSGDTADDHISQSFDQWRKRSNVTWTLDLTWLKDFR